MDDHVLTGLSLRGLHGAMLSGAVTPQDLTERCLQRIAALHPQLHAMVSVDADHARSAALAAANRFHQPGAPLLCGIPVVVKDIVDVAGEPTRCGSPSRSSVGPAEADADVVRAWRDQGAIIVGKTVTQEFAAGTLSPPARNPWDPRRVPGGSSGGSAVAVATGMAWAAIGTDTGGSIRNPAAICGVTGLKPTYGAVSTRGVFPLAGSLDTVGPLARTIDDVWIAYQAMRGVIEASELHCNPDQLRLGVLTGYFQHRVDPAVAAAIDAAVQRFSELGVTVRSIEWEDAAAARAIALLLNRIESAIVHRRLLAPGHDGLDQINPALRVRLLSGQLLPTMTYAQTNAARTVIRDSMARLFQRHNLDAVLAPVAPTTAVLADDPFAEIQGVREDANNAYTRLTQPFNATGQPVLSVPAGFDEHGLPIGLQIAGRPGDEQELCAIGQLYEHATAWLDRVPPVVSHLNGASPNGG